VSAPVITSRSAELMARAERLLPGGVDSPVRAFRSVGGTPRVIERASGARLWDVDGNELIDYIGSWGPMILGHAHPDVIAAVHEAASRGTSFGAPNPGEVALAEEIVAAMPSIEMLRFVNSGTEAAMSAVRLARAFTGRDRIMKMAGGYHGHADALLVRAGSGATGLPASAGVTALAAADTLVVEYNDLDAAAELLGGGEIAAVIVEPVAANMGVVLPADGYLAGLRRLTALHGTLLIFDEVITGFRVARGGAQQHYGIQPDLTVLGKIIGGGLPVGAYGGSAAIMGMMAPLGPVYQAGTLSGNPLAVAAALATLRKLDPPAYERLGTLTEELAAGLRDAAIAAGREVHVQSVPGLLTVFFCANPVLDYASASACDVAAYGAWCRELLARGVYPPPSQFEAWFPSLAHGEYEVRQTLEAAREAFEEIGR
jgi:glutamate-1-semialdehyde 2,1-aminomutase